jgi:hypothetical protein
VLSFDLLNSFSLFDQSRQGYICIIGDGYGFLGTLIKMKFPKAKIIFVNLGVILPFDVINFSRLFPKTKLFHLQSIKDFDSITNYSVVFLEGEQYELLNNLPISLFVNIASMQEMDMPVINKYFNIMVTSSVESYFYCCNREEKILPDGNIIRFADYPWRGDVLVDEPCPWYSKYPSSIPPFWRPFDGIHQHKLIKLDTKC